MQKYLERLFMLVAALFLVASSAITAIAVPGTDSEEDQPATTETQAVQTTEDNEDDASQTKKTENSDKSEKIVTPKPKSEPTSTSKQPKQTSPSKPSKPAVVEKATVALYVYETGTAKGLKGVKYALYSKQKLLKSVTTNGAGVAALGELENGTYTLVETSPPYGYEKAKKSTTFTVNANVAKKKDVIVYNKKIPLNNGIVSIYNKDISSGKAIAGTTYQLLDSATGKMLASKTTNAQGAAQFKSLTVDKTYVVKEIKVSEKYTATYAKYNVVAKQKPVAKVTYNKLKPVVKNVAPKKEVPKKQVVTKAPKKEAPVTKKQQSVKKEVVAEKKEDSEEAKPKEDEEKQDDSIDSNEETSQNSEENNDANNDANEQPISTEQEQEDTDSDLESETPFEEEDEVGPVAITSEDEAPVNAVAKTLTIAPLTFTTQKTGNIKINKYVESKWLWQTIWLSGDGQQFTITGPDRFSEKVTIKNGVASLSNVPIGTYTVTETKGNTGYKIPDPQTVKVENKKTAVVKFYNYKGKTVNDNGVILVKKVDGNSRSLPDAVFGVYDVSDTTYKTPLQTVKSNDRGEVEFTDLTVGKQYNVKEISAPSGYVMSTEVFKATAKEKSKSTSQKTFKNTKKTTTSINITKKDPNGKPIEGVTFKLEKKNSTAWKEESTKTTDANGYAEFPVTKDFSYRIVEVAVPSGYEKTPTYSMGNEDTTTSKTIKVTDTKKDIDVAVTNPIANGSLTVQKLIDGTQIPMAGVTFTLYNDTDDEEIGTKQTNELGQIVFTGLNPTKSYLLMEEDVDGYELVTDLTEPFKLVKDDNGYNLKKVVKNRVVTDGVIEITKTDDSGNTLKDVAFKVTSSDGKVKVTKETGTDGVVTFDELDVTKTYKVEEVAVPEGYTASSDLPISNIKLTSGNDYKFAKTVVNPVDTTGKIQFKKIDQADHPVKGAVFTLYNEDGSAVTPAKTATSDSNGMVTFEGLQVGKKYVVKETTIPEHYEKEDTEKTYQASKDSVNQAPFKNTQLGYIEFTKVEKGTTDKTIAGAKFTAKAPGGASLEATSGADGKVRFDNLQLGTVYTVKETSVPAPYVVDTKSYQTYPKPYVGTFNNPPAEFVHLLPGLFENEKGKGFLRIFKYTEKDSTDQPLKGVEFKVTGPDNYDETVTTNDSGFAIVDDVTIGETYTVKETKALEGYEASTETYTVTAVHELPTAITHSPDQGTIKVLNKAVKPLGKGSITVKKNIVGIGDKQEDKDQQFWFKLCLVDKDGSEICDESITSSPNPQKGSVNDPAVFEGLQDYPSGQKKYQVYELLDEAEYPQHIDGIEDYEQVGEIGISPISGNGEGVHQQATVNNKYKKDSMKVVKELKDGVGDKDRKFTFELYKEGSSELLQTLHLSYNDTHGNASGVKNHFDNLEQNTNYKIVEVLDENDDYSVVGSNTQTVKFHHKKEETHSVTFTNELKPQKGSLTVEKIVNGAGANSDLPFTFELYATNSEGEKTGSPLQTITASANESGMFENIDLNKTYIVKEVQNTDGEYANYAVEQSAEQTITFTNDSKKVTFTNNFTPPVRDLTTVAVQKQLTGDEGGNASLPFTFALYKANEDGEPIGEALETIQASVDQPNSFANLDVGTRYVVKELLSTDDAYANYTIDGEELQSFVAKETNETLTFMNRYEAEAPPAGNVKLVVNKEVTGEGADEDLNFTFNVYKDDDEKTFVQTITASQNERGEIEGLEPGNYIVEEVQDNPNYAVQGNSEQKVMAEGDFAQVTFVNEFRDEGPPPTEGLSIYVNKTVSGENADPNQLFTFDLYEANEDFEKVGESIQTIQASQEQRNQFTGLAPGRYIVEERQTNPNYTTNNPQREVELSDGDGNVEFVNEFIGEEVPPENVCGNSNAETFNILEDLMETPTSGEQCMVILIAHEKGDRNIRLANAVFDLYYAPVGDNYTRIHQNLQTDANGAIELSGLSPGNYYFIQTAAPSPYIKSPDQYPFTIPGTPSVLPPVDEEQPPVDEEQPPVDEEQPPVDEEQPPVDEEQPPVDEEQPPVDEEQPPVDEPQPPVDEEQPPVDEPQPPVDGEQPPVDEPQPPVDGEQPPGNGEQAENTNNQVSILKVSRTLSTFTTEEPQYPITIYVENDKPSDTTPTDPEPPTPKTAEVELFKKDSETGEGIKGAIFNIVKAGTDTIVKENLESDANGVVKSGLLEPGQYEFVEVTPAPKYDGTSATVPFEITSEGKVKDDKPLVLENTLTKGKVVLEKTDSQTSEPIQGAKFNIVNEQNEVVRENLETDAKGQISVNDLPLGAYKFVEVQPAEGYLNTTDTQDLSFTIEKDKEASVNVTNTAKPGSAKLIKQDSVTKEAISGVTFKLVDNEGTTVKENLVTDENGEIVVTDLAPGDYEFIEVEAAKGYVKDATPVAVSIVKNQQEMPTVYKENTLQTGSVVLNKFNSKTLKALKDATFDLYVAGSSEPLQTGLKTDGNGQITVNELAPGNYYFVETKAPKGFTLDQKQLTFEIVVDQQEAVSIQFGNIPTSSSTPPTTNPEDPTKPKPEDPKDPKDPKGPKDSGKPTPPSNGGSAGNGGGSPHSSGNGSGSPTGTNTTSGLGLGSGSGTQLPAASTTLTPAVMTPTSTKIPEYATSTPSKITTDQSLPKTGDTTPWMAWLLGTILILGAIFLIQRARSTNKG